MFLPSSSSVVMQKLSLPFQVLVSINMLLFLFDLSVLSIAFCILYLGEKKNPDNKQSEDWKMSVVSLTLVEGFTKTTADQRPSLKTS